MSSSTRKLGLWALSLIVVLALHTALFCWALYWRPVATPVELPPAAMIIQLEPLPAPMPPPAPPQPVIAPEPEPQPEPKLVEAPKPKLAIAKPKPKPKPRPKPPKPKPEPPKPAEPTPPVEPAPAAEPAPQADSKPAAPAPAVASAPSRAEVSWKSRLLGRLARYKEYPDDARRRNIEGIVKVRFVVDASGRVLSQEVVGSSGNRSLDRATLRMIRRAQPLPRPPADILSNGSVEVVAPFNYQLDR